MAQHDNLCGMDWQQEMRRAVTDIDELLALLELRRERLPEAPAANGFALKAPRPYIARMRKGDPADPLLRQVLSLAAEALPAPGFGADPVGDLDACRGHGVVHKYRRRALLVATGACAIHCRYCFRRNFPYAAQGLGKDLDTALARIAERPEIEEVILSGGDPLTLDNARLGELLRRLDALPQVARLRLHTRLPVVVPARVDAGCARLLSGGAKPRVVVLHINHPAEIDAAVAAAVRRLPAPVFNQAVLLRGVNDSVATLAALSRACFDIKVVPYYLHLLDRVAGAAHFEVPEDEARALHAELQAELPGYLVPRLARDEAGAPAKRLL